MIVFPFKVIICVNDLLTRGSLNAHRSALKDVAGIYGFQNIETGEIVYIGSATNLWRRLLQHINGEKSNEILQKAFSKYGLAAFRFLVFSVLPLDPQVSKAEHRKMLLSAEQLYLDSFNPRYNILSLASSSLGYQHSPETLAKMSGSNNPAYGRTGEANPMFGRTGALHPMFGLTGDKSPNFGKVPANAVPVYVYDLHGELIQEFSSQAQAAQ